MHLTRSRMTSALPIPRKGLRYVAKAMSNSNSGVPVVVAVRDMLNLARTSKEVKHMVNEGSIKINGRKVKDIREGIKLFNIITVGKNYELKILPTGKYGFEETKKELRVCKIIGKKILSGGRTQINLHDGTNIISKDNLKIGDSVELDFSGKITSKKSVDKKSKVFVISGRSVGLIGEVKNIEGKKVLISLENQNREVMLNQSHVIAL